MKTKKDWDKENQEIINMFCSNDWQGEYQQFSKYHIRIFDRVDIWAGSKTYYIRGTSQSNKYKDLKDLYEILRFYAD